MSCYSSMCSRVILKIFKYKGMGTDLSEWTPLCWNKMLEEPCSPRLLDHDKVQGQMEEEKVWPSLSRLRAASIRPLVRASGVHHLNVSTARMLLS